MEAKSKIDLKLNYPLGKISLNLTLNGVFSLPEEWKVLEEANPNFFGYTLRFQNHEFKLGKYN